jgi:uncharacterized DUF497 family protein
MEIRFYIDPETGRPHLEKHGVTMSEAARAWEHAAQDYAGYGGARIALGRASAGRYLKVVYRPLENETGVFIITAYPLEGNELKALRRRMRRKGHRS